MTSKEEAGLEFLHGDSGTGRRTLDCTANQSTASLGTWRQPVFEVSSHTSTLVQLVLPELPMLGPARLGQGNVRLSLEI